MPSAVCGCCSNWRAASLRAVEVKNIAGAPPARAAVSFIAGEEEEMRKINYDLLCGTADQELVRNSYLPWPQIVFRKGQWRVIRGKKIDGDNDGRQIDRARRFAVNVGDAIRGWHDYLPGSGIYFSWGYLDQGHRPCDRSTLTHHDRSKWKNPESDVWSRETAFPAMDIESGEVFCLVLGTIGDKAARKLIHDLRDENKNKFPADAPLVPVVALTSETPPGKDYAIPLFDIEGWQPMPAVFLDRPLSPPSDGRLPFDGSAENAVKPLKVIGGDDYQPKPAKRGPDDDMPF
jgi:hypothetical protein